MSEEKELLVEIDEEGNCHIDALNFHGQGCAEATRRLAEGLGKVEGTTVKPEYEDQLQQGQVQRARH